MEQTQKLSRIYTTYVGGLEKTWQYIHVDGNTYDYWYRPNQHAFEPIEPRIRASGRRGRIAAPLLRTLVKTPRLAALLPGVRQTELQLPAKNPFDAAIVGRRIKTFHLNENRVYTFLNEPDIDILEEVNVRRELPESVNVPEILAVDEEVPYFVEEYLSGNTLTNPLEQRTELFAALEELRPLYEARLEKRMSTETLLADLREQLEGCEEVEETLIEDAYRLLKTFDVPETVSVSQIHGDFHPENILLVDNEVYLLDWEHSRMDLIITDLFMAFEILYTVEETTDFIWGLIDGTGTGGSVANEYASRFGKLAFDKTEFFSGLPVLAFLNRLANLKTDTPRQHPVYNLLRNLTDEY